MDLINPASDGSWFRVVAVDLDGNRYYSNSILIKVFDNQSSAAPFLRNGTLYLQGLDPGNAAITINGADSRIFFTGTVIIQNEHTLIDVGDFPKGIFYLRVVQADDIRHYSLYNPRGAPARRLYLWRMKLRHITIAGGGIAGLLSAWYLSEDDRFRITILEKGAVLSGATGASAGMLAALPEIEFHDQTLFHYGLQSIAQWKTLMNAWSGADRFFHAFGTIEIALTPDDVPYLRRLFEFLKSKEVKVTWLEGQELHDAEPLLSTRVRAGILFEQDMQVDQRGFLMHLVEELRTKSVQILEYREVLEVKNSSDDRLQIITNEGTISSDIHLWATGANGAGVPVPIVPVKGEMLALKPEPAFPLKRVIRIQSKQLGFGYIVPKANRIIVGSTAEQKGFDLKQYAGKLMDNLRRAYAALPATYDLEVLETFTGLRPAAQDHLPIIGQTNHNVFYINGLFRNGILMAPILTSLLSQWICTNEFPSALTPFSPTRFDSVAAHY